MRGETKARGPLGPVEEIRALPQVERDRRALSAAMEVHLRQIAESTSAEQRSGHIENMRESVRELIELAKRPDLVKVLTRHAAAFRPFTMKPMGGEGSAIRAEQDEQIEAHKETLAVISRFQSEPSNG